jgi:hypothetical protein
VLWDESHVSPQPLQLVVVLVAVSQPFVLGGVWLQSAKPDRHPVYSQSPLTHDAPMLCSVSHVCPQAPHVVVEPVNVSHPSASGAVVLQSAQPVAQPEYSHVVPLQVAPVLCIVSHEAPQALQLVVVLVAVSQPSVSGAVFVQSAHPGEHPVYAHVVPLQLAPPLCSVSHAAPHALQLVGVFVFVSQPSVSGAVLVQSAYPARHPV